MNKSVIWTLGIGMALAVPAVILGTAAQAAARDTVQLQSSLDSVGVAFREVSLGNLVADSLRDAGNADIALVAADEILETSIPSGNVAPEHIVQTLRYADDKSDTLVILNLTGAQLLKVAERSVSRVPQPFDGFLQVSGLTIRYDASLPQGQRVKQVMVGGSELKTATTYRVAVTHPLAEGSSGYFRFWSRSDVVADPNPPTIAAALTDYLAAHKILNVHTENRIVAQ